jgi:hypothetical protein
MRQTTTTSLRTAVPAVVELAGAVQAHFSRWPAATLSRKGLHDFGKQITSAARVAREPHTARQVVAAQLVGLRTVDFEFRERLRDQDSKLEPDG